VTRPVGGGAATAGRTGLAKIACLGQTWPVDSRIVERVRELIQRSGLTQKDFAEHIDLEPDRLSKSLSGRRNFSSFELALIAQRRGVTVDWILSGAVPAVPAIAARANLDDAVDVEAIGAVARRFADAHDQLEMLGQREALPAVPPLRAGPYLRAAEELATWAHAQLALTCITAGHGPNAWRRMGDSNPRGLSPNTLSKCFNGGWDVFARIRFRRSARCADDSHDAWIGLDREELLPKLLPLRGRGTGGVEPGSRPALGQAVAALRPAESERKQLRS